VGNEKSGHVVVDHLFGFAVQFGALPLVCHLLRLK
jgi:hypothetical protein